MFYACRILELFGVKSAPRFNRYAISAIFDQASCSVYSYAQLSIYERTEYGKLRSDVCNNVIIPTVSYD